MFKKIGLAATVLLTLALAACGTDAAPTSSAAPSQSAPTQPAPPAQPAADDDIDGEQLLRLYLTIEGNTEAVIEAQIEVAYTVCGLADDMGAEEAINATYMLSKNETREVQMMVAQAVGAGITALCPEHAWAI